MLKQASFISISKLVEKSCSFIIIILLSRIFAPTEMGKFFFYFSLVCLLIPIMDFGLKKLYVIKASSLSAYERCSLLGTLIGLKILCGLAALSIAIAADTILNWGHSSTLAVSCCFLAIFADEFGQLLRSSDHAKEVYTYEIIAPIANKGGCLLAIYFLANQISTIEEALCLYALFNIIGSFISALALRSNRPSFSIKHFFNNGKNLLKQGFPFSLTSLFVMISFFVDSVILGLYSLEENGIYNSAFRIIIVFGVLSAGISHVLFAKFSQAGKNTQLNIHQTLKRITPLVLTLFISIAIGISALSHTAVDFLYDDQYAAAAEILILLSPFVLLSALSNVYAHTLEACGRQKEVMKFNSITCSFNLIANLIFIPIAGMYAAAVTTLITEALNTLLSYRALHKEKRFTVPTSTPLILVFITIMSLTGYIASQLPLFQGILLGAAIFCPLFLIHIKHLQKQIKETSTCAY